MPLIPRASVDKMLNKYGKNLIELCKATGLNMNGRIGPTNMYTCYTARGRSAIDYLLANHLSKNTYCNSNWEPR